MTVITADWQARLVSRDFLLGRGTNYPGLGGIAGLGLGDPAVSDVVRFGDGSAFGRDRLVDRLITMPVVVLGSGSECWQRYRALAQAWRRSAAVEELELRIPGSAETVVSAFGRTMKLAGEPHGLKGAMLTVAEFRAEPYFYGAAASASASASPVTIAASACGDLEADSDRVTIVVAGNGSSPSISNTVTGATVAMAASLAGGASVTLDLRARTATSGGLDVTSTVDAVSDWPRLAGGVINTFSFTGAASIAVTFRPAYQVP